MCWEKNVSSVIPMSCNPLEGDGSCEDVLLLQVLDANGRILFIVRILHGYYDIGTDVQKKHEFLKS